MNATDQIIEELTNPSKSLAAPILKTKVLASRIKNQEIIDWADKEMAGYRDRDDQLPDYNKSDHPLMDALDKSVKLANAVEKLGKPLKQKENSAKKNTQQVAR